MTDWSQWLSMLAWFTLVHFKQRTRYIAIRKTFCYADFACLHWTKQSQHNAAPLCNFRWHGSTRTCNTTALASLLQYQLSLLHRCQFSSVKSSLAGLKVEQQCPPISCLYLLYKTARQNKGATSPPWTSCIKELLKGYNCLHVLGCSFKGSVPD